MYRITCFLLCPQALSFIEENKADFRLKRLKRLPVSGAFHTDLMLPAVSALKKVKNKAFYSISDYLWLLLMMVHYFWLLLMMVQKGKIFHILTKFRKRKKILFRITHLIFLLTWQVFNTITVENPLIPVHSNIDGKYYKDAEQVKKQLPRQICKPVKWEQTMHILYERNRGTAFPLTFECGPGKSLKAILKMCNAKAFDSCSAIEA